MIIQAYASKLISTVSHSAAAASRTLPPISMMASADIPSSISAPGRIDYGDRTISTNYPPLLSPLFSWKVWMWSALFVASLFSVLKRKLIDILARSKVRTLAGYSLLALLLAQEIGLERLLIRDFRSITGGLWGSVDGVTLHYLRYPREGSTTVSQQSTQPRFHCFHGFGANCLSFKPVFDNAPKSDVIAHDVPGFGFSPRQQADGNAVVSSAYRPLWNAKASLALGEQADASVLSALSSASTSASRPLVFMSHSMGVTCALAAAAAATTARATTSMTSSSSSSSGLHPKEVTLVLVSPAFAPLPANQQSLPSLSLEEARDILYRVSRAVEAADGTVISERGSHGNSNSNIESDSKGGGGPVRSLFRGLQRFGSAVRGALSRVFSPIVRTFTFVLSLPLRVLLRRLVHWDSFWFRGLSSAWGTHTLTKQDVYRYKLASMAKGFDSGFFKFVTSQGKGNGNTQNKEEKSYGEAERVRAPVVVDDSFPLGSLIPGVSQVDVLASLVAVGCKVVIVHGSQDTVVPPRVPTAVLNAVERRTASTSSSSNNLKLIMLDGFGHVPHEEDPPKFLSVLRNEAGVSI